MASINYATREISCKIVYYGPGLSGKTTNLQIIHRKIPDKDKSEMVSLATETDRTLFFDFLPLDLGSIKGFSTKFQLYTVPGQVYYNATRKLVLRGVDGVVFVVDSQIDKLQENLESFANLQENLREYGHAIENIPLVLQFNKRDLPNVYPVDQLNALVNKYGLPYHEAVAATGVGVFTTLKAIGKSVIDKFNAKYAGFQGATGRRPVRPGTEPQAAPTAPSAPPAPPAPPVGFIPPTRPSPQREVPGPIAAKPTPAAAPNPFPGGFASSPGQGFPPPSSQPQPAGNNPFSTPMGPTGGMRNPGFNPPPSSSPFTGSFPSPFPGPMPGTQKGPAPANPIPVSPLVENFNQPKSGPPLANPFAGTGAPAPSPFGQAGGFPPAPNSGSPGPGPGTGFSGFPGMPATPGGTPNSGAFGNPGTGFSGFPGAPATPGGASNSGVFGNAGFGIPPARGPAGPSAGAGAFGSSGFPGSLQSPFSPLPGSGGPAQSGFVQPSGGGSFQSGLGGGQPPIPPSNPSPFGGAKAPSPDLPPPPTQKNEDPSGIVSTFADLSKDDSFKTRKLPNPKEKKGFFDGLFKKEK